MRGLRRDQYNLKYALRIGESKIYVTDENGDIEYSYYEDSDGNKIYYLDGEGNRIPLDTGERQPEYSGIKEFRASISMSGGEAEAVEYGLSTSDFEAIALYPTGNVPLKEGALIWFRSEVVYRYGGKEVEIETETGENIRSSVPLPSSADYLVVKIDESKNFTRAILKSVNK